MRIPRRAATIQPRIVWIIVCLCLRRIAVAIGGQDGGRREGRADIAGRYGLSEGDVRPSGDHGAEVWGHRILRAQIGGL